LCKKGNRQGGGELLIVLKEETQTLLAMVEVLGRAEEDILKIRAGACRKGREERGKDGWVRAPDRRGDTAQWVY